MRKPNYKKASGAAYEILKKLNISTFPISLFDIIEELPNLKVLSFCEMAELLGISVGTVAKDMAMSEEGAIGTFGTEKVIIIYNSDISTKSLERERFTLAHEIGHYILGHPFDTDNSILSRNNGITNEESKIFELEANHFARELLAPTFLIDDTDPLTTKEISNRFEISTEASKYAIDRVIKGRSRVGLYHLNLLVPDSWIDDYYPRFYDTITYVKKVNHRDKIGMTFNEDGFRILYKKLRYCYECKSIQIYHYSDQILYCSCCGANNIKEVNNNNYFEFHEREEQRLMEYTKLIVDEVGRLNQNCPICDNDHVSDNYCSICGIYIINECSGMVKTERDNNWNNEYEQNDPCQVNLQGSDRFCPKCGAESTFYKNGLLKAWNEPTFELPF